MREFFVLLAEVVGGPLVHYHLLCFVCMRLRERQDRHACQDGGEGPGFVGIDVVFERRVDVAEVGSDSRPESSGRGSLSEPHGYARAPGQVVLDLSFEDISEEQVIAIDVLVEPSCERQRLVSSLDRLKWTGGESNAPRRLIA